MKLPSIKQLVNHTTRTFFRFPGALLSAALGAVAVIILIEDHNSAVKGTLNNLFLASALGLPLLITLPILAERLKLTRTKNVLGQAACALVLAYYYFSLPADAFSSPEIHVIRFFLLNLALHLLVAIAPYVGRDQINGFWQYNKSLFLRFLTAALYSGVLFAGLSIALAAIDHLFEIHVDGKRYPQMWILIAGMFNTWFFLAGVPENLDELDKDTSYPKGLKIFTQYVLLPLVVVYLAILYAYEAKIIMEWSWPKGWVANLVLGFSVTGILALLLVYPVQQAEENKWIKTFAKWYYVALIPLVFMLLLAIWRRLSEYGVTENRYFVLVLGACLGLIVIYFIVSRTKNIKIIPITLCLVSLLSAFGPWGTFAVSARSQKSRLKALLLKNEILVDSRVQKAAHAVPSADSKEISSIVSYLLRVHGPASMQPWFTQDLNALSDSGSVEYAQTKAARLVGLMGVTYVNQWQSQTGNDFNVSAGQKSPIPIAGYDYLVRLQDFHRESKTQAPVIDQKEFTLFVEVDGKNARLAIYARGNVTDSILVDLAPVVTNLIEEYGMSPAYGQVPVERMEVERESHSMRAKIYFTTLQGQKVDDRVTISNLQGDLLLERKKD